MIDNYTYAELFLENKVQKNFIITDGVVSVAGGSFVYNDYTYLLTNDDLKSVPKIYEMLTDEKDLDFGRCNSNYIEFSIAADVIPLIGKNCRVYIWMNDNINTLFRIGKYTITSDKATADRNYRNIVAYDKMKELKEADVTDWYNSLFPTEQSVITVKAMRESFCQHFGVDDITDTDDMVNDSVVFGKTITPSDGGFIQGEVILWAFCSINGGFGNVNRNGDFRCIVLKSGLIGLYPRVDLYPAEEGLYPREEVTTMIGAAYYIPPLAYEDYYTEKITQLQIREDDDDLGVSVGEVGNDYIMEGNFICFGKNAEELETIATRLLSKIQGMSYMPFNVRAFGNPCFEVGDPVRFRTGDVIVNTYILKRTLTGTIALDDEYEAVGNQYRSDSVSNMANDITKLKSKTLKIKRSVDELSIELNDFEAGTAAEFLVQAGQISSKVSQSDYNGNTIASLINQTATTVLIQASKIHLEGNTLINGVFGVGNDGSIWMHTPYLEISNSDSDEILSIWGDDMSMWGGGICVDVNASNEKWLDINGWQGGALFDHVAVNGQKVHVGYQSDSVRIYHCKLISAGIYSDDDDAHIEFEVRQNNTSLMRLYGSASNASDTAPYIYLGDASDSGKGIRLKGSVQIGNNTGTPVELKGREAAWTSFSVDTITIDGQTYNVLTASGSGSYRVLTGT